jgi:hypothetical protein
MPSELPFTATGIPIMTMRKVECGICYEITACLLPTIAVSDLGIDVALN